jgi:hypothetical protein
MGIMKELYDLVPPFKRAQNYRLYDYKGNSYIDLCQNNGHSILGHRPHGMTKLLKNTVSRGLIYDIPSVYQKRLKKELAFMFAQFRSFYIFKSLEAAVKTAGELLNIRIMKISDPVFNRIDRISYYRPFLPDDIQKALFAKAEVIIPVLPFSIAGSPVAVCFKERVKDQGENHISPFILACTLKSIYNLRKAALHKYKFNIKNKNWTKTGIYLVSNEKQENYPAVFKYFLKNGILISPDCRKPSVLPGTASPGEVKKIIGIFENITDNI